MLIPRSVWRALLDTGVDLVPADSRHVELRYAGQHSRLAVHTSSRPLKPSDVTTLTSRSPEPGLLIFPAASTATRTIAERDGWSWLSADDRQVRGLLRIGQSRVEVRTGDSAAVGTRRARPGRAPRGTLTIVRRLLTKPGAPQRALATMARISQPRVSQVLKLLRSRGLVRQVRGGWAVDDVDGMIDWWLDEYPGHGGFDTYWYGLTAPREQSLAVVEWARRLGSQRRLDIAVSGDVAADAIAPWRSPARAVIYARAGLDLTETGLAPAAAEEATLEFIVPDDRGIWPAEPWARSGSMPLADPLQVLWDVRRSPGADREEAVAHLRNVLRRCWKTSGEDRSA